MNSGSRHHTAKPTVGLPSILVAVLLGVHQTYMNVAIAVFDNSSCLCFVKKTVMVFSNYTFAGHD
jgi:hypothetical protein